MGLSSSDLVLQQMLPSDYEMVAVVLNDTYTCFTYSWFAAIAKTKSSASKVLLSMYMHEVHSIRNEECRKLNKECNLQQ